MPLNTDLGSDAKKIQREEQRKIDDAEELTEDEQLEKEDLLQEVSLKIQSTLGPHTAVMQPSQRSLNPKVVAKLSEFLLGLSNSWPLKPTPLGIATSKGVNGRYFST